MGGAVGVNCSQIPDGAAALVSIPVGAAGLVHCVLKTCFFILNLT